ncbi:MAG: uracil-DNA glycosylase, partial [Gemmatimonadetes bacterium]|nr:uracil-DNA glycosylase [Gemmatimonadota bacterium]
LVVPLGRIGHVAWLKTSGWWDRLSPAERPTFHHGAEAVLPDGTVLLCSYHPSRQNTNTGKLTRAMWHGIFRRARRIIDSA